ncbi:MAG: carbohydrate ABC transporter permease [Bifidobacteriaceae bacterium]|nr:carbohydrate ABC transporter permease [Bifidobacteriaceae bacterium]
MTARLLAILVVLGLAVFPIYWMLVTATTPNAKLFSSKLSFFPDLGEFSVFGETFSDKGVMLWLWNSAIIALGTAALALVLAIPLGYALSRFRFRGKGLAGVALLMTQMLPEALLVVPLFGIFRNLNLLDSRLGLIMVNAAFVLPVVCLLIKNGIDGTPRELDEAARVDGCGPWRTLLRINLPLIAPTIAAAAVIAFFHGWNEFVFAVTFIFTDDKFPASVGIANFVGEQATSVHAMMSAALMYTIPAVVFYLIVQRYVVTGMTAGSVKG